MADLDLRTVVSAHDDRNIIIDYHESDFENYWDGACKALLHRRECDIIKRLLPPSDGWFIDLGCGFGRLVPTYLGPKKRIVAVDYSVKHLEAACRTYPQDNILFVAADAHHLPFRDSVFSSGICIRLFHHIASADAFLRELSRVFARDACLLFNYMNKRNLLRVLRYGRRSFEHDHTSIARVLFAIHPEFFARLARESGFTTISQKGTGFIHQIAHRCHCLERWANTVPFLLTVLAAVEHLSSLALGHLGLALMQYVLLRKVSDADATSSQDPPPESLIDILLCPYCRSTELREDEAGLKCTLCGNVYSRRGRIYDFRFGTMPLPTSDEEAEVPVLVAP